MPMLRIGTRTFEADAASVTAAAERLFRLSPARRQFRVEAAKSQLVRAVEQAREDGPAARKATATILSQGITAI